MGWWWSKGGGGDNTWHRFDFRPIRLPCGSRRQGDLGGRLRSPFARPSWSLSSTIPECNNTIETEVENGLLSGKVKQNGGGSV